jgi:hypothetical protein
MNHKDVGHLPLMKEWEYFVTKQQLFEVEVAQSWQEKLVPWS